MLSLPSYMYFFILRFFAVLKKLYGMLKTHMDNQQITICLNNG